MPPKGKSFEGHPDAGKVAHNPQEKNKTCFNLPDFYFLLLWLTSFVIMLWMCFEYGVIKLNHEYDIYRQQQQKLDSFAVDDIPEKELDRSILGCKHVIKIFGWCGLYSIILSFVWVILMTTLGHVLIDVVMYSGMLIFMIWGIICVVQLDAYSGSCFAATFFILAGLVFIFWCCMRVRNTFVSTSLSVACKFVRTNFMLYFVALLMVLACASYALVWSLAEFGIYYHLQPSVSNPTRCVVYALLFLMYMWTMQVCRNIIVVTVSGTGAEWWFSQGLREPTFMAFLRAITYDFGPICFGSVFVSLATTFNPSFVYKYAFTYVGIYGYGFLPAGRKVQSLFVNEGTTVIRNDTVVEYVIFFANIVVALSSCCLAVIMAEDDNNRLTTGLHPYARFLTGTMGFFIGLTIASTMHGIVDAANKLVFVLFLENPHVLEVTHSDEHARLSGAWKMIGLKDSGPGDDSYLA